jgi:hypothetical protein
LPAGAEVLAGPTSLHRVVYRLGDRVVKLLKPNVYSDLVREMLRVAAPHPDLFEPFEFFDCPESRIPNPESHPCCRRIEQRFLGYRDPTDAAFEQLVQAIRHRGIGVSDVVPKNVRGAELGSLRVIDFSVFCQPQITAMPRGVHRSKKGRSIKICDATVEELQKLGKLIKWN